MADATALLAQLTQAATPLPSASAPASTVEPADEPSDPAEPAEPAPASDEAPGAEDSEAEEEGEEGSDSDDDFYWDKNAAVSAIAAHTRLAALQEDIQAELLCAAALQDDENYLGEDVFKV